MRQGRGASLTPVSLPRIGGVAPQFALEPEGDQAAGHRRLRVAFLARDALEVGRELCADSKREVGGVRCFV